MSALRITSIEEVIDPVDRPARAMALYEDACRALSEVVVLDAAVEIVDRADALRVYAHRAKNRQLEVDAADIRIRAERRVGQLIVAQRESVGLNRGAKGSRVTGSEREPVKDDRPTLAEAGVDKKLSSRAQRLAALPDERFLAALGEWREAATREAGRVTVTLVRGTDKRVARAVREEVLGRQQRALPEERFGVIYADPEWRFEPRSRKTGLDRAADNHYPTSHVDEIKARPVQAIAADHCALLLWSTVPMLPEGLAVLAAWGFTYRSHVAWRKLRPGASRGTGYWFHNEHELLLLGTRGSPPCPAPGDQWPSVVDAPVGRHSAKPERFLELIEDYWPTLPKIELNRRGPARDGWSAWGNEAGPQGDQP